MGRALLFERCVDESLYTLTRIYSVGYTKRVESVFEIIAEPNRRAILSLLVSSQQSVGEIERQLRMPQPTVSKHLRVLREAGFVESTVDAQRRLYRLKPEPLQEVDAWLAPFRRVLVRSRRCSRTPPRPHGAINTRRKGRQGEEDDRSRSVHTGSGQRARRCGRTERSGRSFSSENCATRRKKSGRR